MKKIYQDSTFYLIIFILSYFIYIYPIEILNEFLFKEMANRRLSLYYSLLVSVIIIFYFRSKNTFYPIKIFVYEGMGIGFISFWVVNVALILNFFLNINTYKLGIITLILIIFIVSYGLLYGRLIFLKNLTISSNKILNNYNFIFISDVHLGSNSINHLKNILKKIENIQYDFLLIGGDLIDSSSFNISKLSIFNSINKPIFFVSGNHEYYVDNYKEKLNKLKDFGIKILNNESSILKEINLVGIDDNQLPEQQLKHALKLIKNNNFNLLLIHKPSIWFKIKGNVDLMLSGHTHNGQIFPFNFFVRLKFKYKYGLYTNETSNLYVSSGSACWGPKIRIGTRNEIIYINLKSKIKN